MSCDKELLALADRHRPDVYSSGEVALSSNNRWVRLEDFKFATEQIIRALAGQATGGEDCLGTGLSAKEVARRLRHGEPLTAPQPEAQAEKRERLELERNALMNSYGDCAYTDGRITRRIADIDTELATLAMPTPSSEAGGEVQS